MAEAEFLHYLVDEGFSSGCLRHRLLGNSCRSHWACPANCEALGQWFAQRCFGTQSSRSTTPCARSQRMLPMDSFGEEMPGVLMG